MFDELVQGCQVVQDLEDLEYVGVFGVAVVLDLGLDLLVDCCYAVMQGVGEVVFVCCLAYLGEF